MCSVFWTGHGADASSRERRPRTGHPDVFAPGGFGQPSPHVGMVARESLGFLSSVYSTYTYGLAGNCGSSSSPSSPRSQKSCTCGLKSANTAGVVAVRLANTLMRPLFSATNTRPSEANLTTIGALRPLNTVMSLKFGGSGCAAAARATTRQTASSESDRHMDNREMRVWAHQPCHAL